MADRARSREGWEKIDRGGERIWARLRKMGQDGLRGGGRNRSPTNMSNTAPAWTYTVTDITCRLDPDAAARLTADDDIAAGVDLYAAALSALCPSADVMVRRNDSAESRGTITYTVTSPEGEEYEVAVSLGHSGAMAMPGDEAALDAVPGSALRWVEDDARELCERAYEKAANI